jgi:pyrroloquinoline-quinone synthase
MRAPRVLAAAMAAIAARDLAANPYFASLRDGGMDLARFRASQRQFAFAVDFFPRPMAALVGRIPDPALRLDILRNLVEEHGGFERDAFHASTIRAFLARIGAEPASLDAEPLSPAVRAFNLTLTGACVHDELEVGIACMGAIEQAFAGISAAIGGGVVARGWLPPEQMVHYRLHAEIDGRHAEEFFAVIEPAWDDARRRYLITQGLALGAYALDRLFRDLA